MFNVICYHNGKAIRGITVADKEKALEVYNSWISSSFQRFFNDRIVITDGNTILFDSED